MQHPARPGGQRTVLDRQGARSFKTSARKVSGDAEQEVGSAVVPASLFMSCLGGETWSFTARRATQARHAGADHGHIEVRVVHDVVPVRDITSLDYLTYCLSILTVPARRWSVKMHGALP